MSFLFTRFGFGLMNAIDMVELAEVWQNVGRQEKCEISVNHHLPRYNTMSCITLLLKSCKKQNTPV